MGLREYAARRLSHMVVTFWVFITVIFFLFRVMPGDPTARFALQLPKEAREQIIRDLGLNQPLHVQYIKYVEQLFNGNLGISYIYRDPVWEILVVKFWNTIFLMSAALLLAFTVGITLGALLAWKRGGKLEFGGIIAILVTRSMPSFWIGIVLISLFAFQLELFPAANMRSVGTEFSGFWSRYLSWDFVYHAVLPVVTTALYTLAVPALLMRNTMLEVLNTDFIESKQSMGLSTWTVLYKHAVRNSILPIVTVAALAVGRAIGGQVLVEVVFNWPGMGRAMVDAVLENDYPLAMGAFLFMGTVTIVMNFVADLLYVYLDPRIKYD